jgi:Cu2+-exporting ATPase
MATAVEPRPASALTATTCAHCGLTVASGDVRTGDAHQFCCAGCRTAFAILHEHGLDQYYGLPARREAPVRTTSRSYEEFDHPSFHDLCVQGLANGLCRTVFVLEGVHCASCVWLVERVPMIVPGTIRAELDFRRSQVTLTWDPARTALSTIARTLASLGYPPHAVHGRSREELRQKEDRAALVGIGVAGAIAINVMLAALAMYAGWFGDGLEREYERFFRWVSLGLVIPALAWPGRVFFRGAWAAVRTRTLHLDLPIAIALGAGFVRGAVNTITDSGPIYLDGIAILIFLLLVGRYLQRRWQRAATDASELLQSITPEGARIVAADGTVTEIPATALLPGMLLAVRSGDTLAADGEIEDGETSLDLAWLTGESRPVAAGPGTPVFAGSLNVGSPVRVRVRQSGTETRVARLLAQVEESAQHRAPVVLLANRLAGVFVGVVLVLAVVTFVLWAPRDVGDAVDHAVALLIVTCPCALAMATPLSVTVALGRAARQGIFIRGGDSLQVLAGRGRLFLDKTGTITEGRGALATWVGPEWVKPLILALESGSSHPIAAGFRRAWPDIAVHECSRPAHILGGGITGRVDHRDVVVGSPAFVRAHVGGGDADAGFALADDGTLTPVWVAVDGQLVAVAGFGDPVRVDSAPAIAALEARGWEVAMLSGDDERVCVRVARDVGLPPQHVLAECTPEVKRDAVNEARRAGSVVMVGDGVNDAAALASASVGIAVHGGADVAMSTADAYLTTSGLGPVVSMIDGAHRTMRVVRRNIALSLAYNVAGVALAMTGVLNPVIAAIMMPLSSLTVVAGAWYGTTFEDRA